VPSLRGGTGRAAADSLPGDVTYPLKRAAEQVQLALAADETTRLRVLAELADHRLAELAGSIKTHASAKPIAQAEYAEAIAHLTKQANEVRSQANVSDDKKNAAEDIVDAVHLKHTAVLEQLGQQGSDEDKQDVEQAKDESSKLHASGKPARTAEPSDKPEHTQTSQPTRSGASHKPEVSGSPQPTGNGNGDSGGDQGDKNESEQTQSPHPSKTPGPTKTGDTKADRTSTPSPSIRR
jgi:hypothetical protein